MVDLEEMTIHDKNRVINMISEILQISKWYDKTPTNEAVTFTCRNFDPKQKIAITIMIKGA